MPLFDEEEKERQRKLRGDERERNKMSWREIDQLRDKSSHAPRDRRPSKKEWEQGKEKNDNIAALQSLFGDRKPDKEEAKFLKAIREANNKQDFAKSVARHERKFGLPKDWGTLMLLLDHEESRIVLHAIKHLRAMSLHRLPEEQELLASHLKVLKMTTRDEEVEDAAEKCLSSS